jgi:UDP-2,3-diacylglucosamine pyrophosphatase LpxH
LAGKIVVISDTHFGDRAMLLDDQRLVDRLMEAITSRGQISELILLGDILDLWINTLMPAMRKARYFIESLSRQDNIERIVYVPGNHDHQMFMDAFRQEMESLIKRRKLSTPKFMPARTYDETVFGWLAGPESKASFSMTYPFLVRSVSGKEVVFAHGHHLDFYSNWHGWFRNFWLVRHVMKKRRKKATLHDIEMANIPFCGAMSATPWVPELVNEALRFYHILSWFGRLFRTKTLQHSPLRDTLIKENYDEIALLLPQLEHPRPDCFIFGHTHLPGTGRLPKSDVAVANTGCWLKKDKEEAPNRTWIEVDGGVKLFRLGRSGEELLDELDL